MGASGRQAALSRLQLAAGDAGGADAHAPMTRVVLASASPGRLKVLRQAGVEPLVVVSGVDEDAVIAAQVPVLRPIEVVCALAAREGRAVSLDRLTGDVAADCVVIGCDSMLFIDGGCAASPAHRRRSAPSGSSMAGRSGELLHRALRAPAARRRGLRP